MASDRDGLSLSGAAATYTYVRTNGHRRTLTVKANPTTSSQDSKGTWFFRFDIPVTNDWGFTGSMTAFMKTTDKYGGTGKVSVPYSFGQGC